MARSISGGFKDPVVKPPIPLRYQISPVEKSFDDLEQLQWHLNCQWDKGKIQWEEYEHLKDVLDARREVLNVRRLKASGNYIAPPTLRQMQAQAAKERKAEEAQELAEKKRRLAAIPPPMSSGKRNLIMFGLAFLAFLIICRK